MPSHSRRGFLGSLAAGFLLDRFAAPLLAAADLGSPVVRGRRFLAGLFDPALDLLPEYRGAKVYWLFHDNYLAAKVLAQSHRDLAGNITAAMHRLGVDHSGKIEIVFGEAKHPLPFRQYAFVDVKRIGEKIIKTEVVTEKVLRGWEEYADLLFLAAIAETDRAKSRRHFNDGVRLWDGMGFKDRAASKRYATYKLALCLIAAARVEMKPDAQAAIVERLLAMQAEHGGWITDYDQARKPLGKANVETTCLAILGLEAVARA
jgi:hypothetical protein